MNARAPTLSPPPEHPRVKTVNRASRRRDMNRAWKEDAKLRSTTGVVLDRDLSAVNVDSPLGNRQAEACTARISGPRFVDAKEAMKNTFAMFGGNAGAPVSDG